jgi:hypothetical protein
VNEAQYECGKLPVVLTSCTFGSGTTSSRSGFRLRALDYTTLRAGNYLLPLLRFRRIALPSRNPSGSLSGRRPFGRSLASRSLFGRLAPGRSFPGCGFPGRSFTGRGFPRRGFASGRFFVRFPPGSRFPSGRLTSRRFTSGSFFGCRLPRRGLSFRPSVRLFCRGLPALCSSGCRFPGRRLSGGPPASRLASGRLASRSLLGSGPPRGPSGRLSRLPSGPCFGCSLFSWHVLFPPFNRVRVKVFKP